MTMRGPSRRASLPRWDRALHAAGLTVLVAVVAVFVVVAVPQVVGADHSFVVLSSSMEPAIDAGDVIVVRSVPADAVETGDVVTFDDGGQRTTHRVVAVEESGGEPAFHTKGDANEDADLGLVTADELVGEVRFTVPLAGYVVLFANTKLGALTLLVVPAVLLVASEVRRLAGLVGDGGDADAAADGGEPR